MEYCQNQYVVKLSFQVSYKRPIESNYIACNASQNPYTSFKSYCAAYSHIYPIEMLQNLHDIAK